MCNYVKISCYNVHTIIFCRDVSSYRFCTSGQTEVTVEDTPGTPCGMITITLVRNNADNELCAQGQAPHKRRKRGTEEEGDPNDYVSQNITKAADEEAGG